ncbi:MAG: CBS domain-containing protein [Candidatus Aenigmatarchaeota archaeon]
MNKNVITVSPDDSLEEAIEIFSNNRISGAPAVKDGKVVGMLSESDIIKQLSIKSITLIDHKNGEKLRSIIKNSNLKVSEIMNKNIYFVKEEDDIANAVRIMYEKDVNRLVVVNKKGALSGIITRSDITKTFSTMKIQPEKIIPISPISLETEIDKLLQIIQERSSVHVDELSRQLNVPEERIEEWGRILEEHGLIEINYSPIGKPMFKKKG